MSRNSGASRAFTRARGFTVGPIMRTTVGPLPSAVYWRRRAVVLGAVLLGIIVLFVSCSGGDDGDGKGNSSSSQYPTPAPNSSADPTPSFLEGAPGAGPALPAPSDLQSRQPGTDAATAPTLPTQAAGNGQTGAGQNGTGQNANVTAPGDGSCADSEIALTPVPSAATLKRGATVEIQLKIKNNSARTCTRDVGADPQELYIDQGARKYWSSDTCSTAKGSDVRQLQPGEELSYKVTWNGRQSSSCAGGSASGPNPPPGQFELRGRLGSLYSQPVAITIAA